MPLFPTTTIGSFPQTPQIRKMRSAFKSGSLSHEEYRSFIREKIDEALEQQETLGLDVLVHGEFERSDMVEFFDRKTGGHRDHPTRGGSYRYRDPAGIALQ